MDALQGKVDSIDSEVREIGDALRDYLDAGTTPARKVKPPGTKAGRELLQHLLGRLEQVSTQLVGVSKLSSGLTPLPTGPNTPLSYGSPVAQQSQSPSRLRDAPRDAPPSPSPAAALPQPQPQPQPQPHAEHVAPPLRPDEPVAAPVLARPEDLAARPDAGSASSPLQKAGPLLSDHASPLFTCTYRDINLLNEDLFEEYSRHPIVRDRGYFKLDVQDLPLLKVEKMARPTKDHATSFCYKNESRSLIKVDTGKRVKFSSPKLPFPRSQKSRWTFEEQRDLWNSTALDPPKGTRPYIIGNPLFQDVELSPGEKLRSRGRTVLEGINTQYVYFNLTGKTITTMHREDAHVRSENLLRSGANKFWCFVKPTSTKRMEEQLRLIYPTMRGCSQSVRHLSLHIPPYQLDEWGVEYTLDYCVPGQAIVTEPGTYHQVLNLGPNYAIAINVEYLSSPDFPIDYFFCDDNCPDKFAMSPEDFLIYPKPPLPGVEPAREQSGDEEGTEPKRLEEAPKNSRPQIAQTPVPLPKETLIQTEHIPSDQSLADNAGAIEQPTRAEPRIERPDALPPQQPPPKQTESDAQTLAKAASLPSREHLPQTFVPQASLPVTERTRTSPINQDRHILTGPHGRTTTNTVEQTQLPSQQATATQAALPVGTPVFTAKKSRALPPPVVEPEVPKPLKYQHFQPLDVPRPSEPKLDWCVPFRPEPPVLPRPVPQKNPFSQSQRQPLSVPSLPPNPVYTSKQFLPYSNQTSPAPSPFQQSFFPTPQQNPGLYYPGGGFSPKTIRQPASQVRPASPELDQVAQAAAALASMPNSSPPAPPPPPPKAPAKTKKRLAAAAPAKKTAKKQRVAPVPAPVPTAAPARPPAATPIITPIVTPIVNLVPAPIVSSVSIPVVNSAPVPTVDSVSTPSVGPVPTPAVKSAPVPALTSVPVPAINSVPVPAINSVPVPAINSVPVPAINSVPVPAKVPEIAAQNFVPMAAPVPPSIPPSRAIYRNLALMVQSGGVNRAETLSSGFGDNPAASKAAFYRLDQLVKEWRMMAYSIVPEGKLYEFINKVDEMAHFTTPIHIFLRRLIRMKMAGLVYNSGNNGEEQRVGAAEDITSLLEKLKWPESDRGKLLHYIREGKCWKTICNNNDGMLCIMPLNTDLSDLGMFREEVNRFHDRLASNIFVAALDVVGKQLATAIWEGKELTEFVWENYNTNALDPAEILPLLQPYASIPERNNCFSKTDFLSAPKPQHWSEIFPDWPSDPSAVRNGERYCSFCKRKQLCQCSLKRMPDVPRVEIDGTKGLGIRSRGEHKKGEILGELLGELVPVGSHPNEWTFELRRPDMQNDIVAEIYTGRRGNWARKVNHSLEPTARFKVAKMSGRWRVLLELLKSLEDGEEITAEFGRGYRKGADTVMEGTE